MTLTESLLNLENYIEANNYKGFDPYDALKSPIFRLPLFKSNKFIRFGTQQLIKRLPFNIRPLLFVPKGYNPVTLGLCIQAYSYLYSHKINQEHLSKINFLVNELKKLIPKGFSGACWGYDFEWEARHAKIPAYQPTVVATGIIANALFEAYLITGNEKCSELVKSAAKFVVNDLNRTYEEENFIFSYSPFDQQKVFNASMKGVRLLTHAYHLTGKPEYKVLADKAVLFVLNYQREDGSWGYSLANSGGWTDNYHTGYVLDCLDEYAKLTHDTYSRSYIQKGFDFYKNEFFTDEGIPKFYHDKIYPVDCTAAGQSILTLTRFGEIELAKKVSQWMVENMQSKEGYFYFRKYKFHTEKTSFMRWSNAWMFSAISFLQYKLKN